MNSFSDYYFVTYSTKTLSFEHFFCLATYFLIFAVPFYFAFAGSNFWFEESYSELDIKYSYTGYYAVEVSYLEGTTNTVEQYSNIPNSPLTSLKQVSLDAKQEDTQTELILQIDGFGAKQIQSLNFIVYYNVEIPSLEKTYSAGSAFSITGNVNIGEISGKLRAKATEPLNGLTTKESQTVNFPIYFARNFVNLESYSQLMQRYLATHVRIQQDIHISTAKATTDSRTITVNLVKDTKVVLPYYPSILQTLKLKFSRYIGFLILSYLIFRSILVMLIEEEGLQCHKTEEIPPVKKI